MCRYVKFGPVVQEMSFEDTSYLELWQPLCSVDWKHLCNFGGRHHEEQYCTIILNLDQRVQQEMRLKAFFYLELWLPSCSVELNHLRYHGENPCYMKFGPVVQEEMSFKDISFLELW